MTPILIFFLLARPSGAVEYSSAAYAGPAPVPVGRQADGPIRLDFLYDNRRGATAEIGYFLRWDGADIRGLPRNTVRVLRNPFRSAENVTRDAISSANIGFYSMRFRLGRYLPVDSLLRPLSLASDALEPERGGEGGRSAVRERKRRRRLRESLTPVMSDLERSLQREIRRGLIRTGFDYAIPAGRNASFGQKEAVFESLREAKDSWEEDRR